MSLLGRITYARLIIRGLREHKISDKYITKVKGTAGADNPDIAAEMEKL